MLSPSTWRATPEPDYNGPKIALIHGLLAGDHMYRHLLTFVRNAGYQDASLYSNHLSPKIIAKELVKAAGQGQTIVLIGYSQGGSQVVKVAKLLERHKIPVKLMVKIAAGGYGRLHPAQWGFNMRRIPANVERCLNYYSEIDRLGSDKIDTKNHGIATAANTHIENICYPKAANIDHLSICRCYPQERVPTAVKTQCLDRILSELERIDNT